MSRAVGKRRMTRENRETSIKNALLMDRRNGYSSSLSSIARELDISPSTYLLNILKRMVISNEIDCKLEKISNNRERYVWSLPSVEGSMCNLPWKCNARCKKTDGSFCEGYKS